MAAVSRSICIANCDCDANTPEICASAAAMPGDSAARMPLLHSAGSAWPTNGVDCGWASAVAEAADSAGSVMTSGDLEGCMRLSERPALSCLLSVTIARGCVCAVAPARLTLLPQPRLCRHRSLHCRCRSEHPVDGHSDSISTPVALALHCISRLAILERRVRGPVELAAAAPPATSASALHSGGVGALNESSMV